MRIGIDARELAGRATGVGRYLAELLARWTRADWARDNLLVLLAPDTLDPTAPWLGVGGASWVIEPLPGTGSTWWEQGTLARAARRTELDVFFAPAYTAPLALWVPTVVAIHDVSFSAHPEWFRPREGLRRRVLTRRAAHRAAAIVTLTRFSRDEIVRCLDVSGERITVIPPAVDAHPALVRAADARPARALEAGNPPRASVLYVGSIFNRRHVPQLIDAFGDLARDKTDLGLELVGADRTFPPEHIAERLRASGARDRITWRPWVEEPELRLLYGRARAFAFLSEYEGFGLTPLEALAARVPPLVSDVAVAREAYGEAAVFVDASDRSAVTESLRRLLEDEALRAGVLAAAPGVLARYSWETSASRTLDVLRAAASKPR